MDLYSRFVVGWAISAVNDRHLTIKALEMALKRRSPGLGLLHHSDQGSTLRQRGLSAMPRRRLSCLTTSTSSITSGVDTRPQVG